ncbi:MAG: hypothetical protein R3213_01795 [Flavobacteriaceae bacterium]|nr:hypothetical protein [Flavobacteriaceae bacterium]
MSNNLLETLNERQIWKTAVAYPAAAFVLLQAVDFFTSHYGFSTKWLTFSLILLIGGFVIALIWTWNHGSKGRQRFSAKEKIIYSSIAVLTLLVGSYYWTNAQTPLPIYPDENYEFSKLAVVPFTNNSKDSSLVYLTDGIPENLMNRLAMSTNLEIISKNSTFILKKAFQQSDYIKERLGADLLLTGSIEKLKDNIVVNGELINTSTNTRLWGDQISYVNNDITEVEEYLTSSIIKSLPRDIIKLQASNKSELSPNPEARANYMKGRVLSYGSTSEEAEKALDFFRKAIEIDPNFAAAYAAIANEKIIQAMFSTATREEIFNEARIAVQTALALNPNSAEAHYLDGSIKFYRNFDWDGAEESYKKAIEVGPNDANAFIRYSAFLAWKKDSEEAIRLANRAIEIDPISISSLHNLGWVHLLLGNNKQSEDAFTEALTLHPNWTWGYIKRAYARARLNKCELAQEDLDSARKLMGEWGSELIESGSLFVYNRCGNQTELKKRADIFLERVTEDNYEDPFTLYYVYYNLGEYEKALEWANRSIDEKAPSTYLMNIELFVTQEFLEDERFKEVRRRMNFPGSHI